MAVVVASSELSDEEFLAAFTRCELPPNRFRHGDHLRLAWLQLHRLPIEEALTSVRDGIQKFAAHHGQSHLYHETITVAWVRLLATHHERNFEEFLAFNEHRLNRELLERFWSPAVLSSDAARLGWVPPDRKALPN
jgi:hypothetical protein